VGEFLAPGFGPVEFTVDQRTVGVVDVEAVRLLEY
jgi:hypothetical protein